MTNSPKYMSAWHAAHPGAAKRYGAKYRRRSGAKVTRRIAKWKRDNHARYRASENVNAKRRYHANIEKFRARFRAYQKTPAFRRYAREWMKQKWAMLTDSMVRKLICMRSNLKASQVPQSMVEAVREIVKVRRVLRERSKTEIAG